MKIAALIQAHKQPDLVEALVNRMSALGIVTPESLAAFVRGPAFAARKFDRPPSELLARQSRAHRA